MIKSCVVGLGGRGFSLLSDVLLKNPDIEIISLCDLYEDRVERAIDKVKECEMQAKGFSNYKEALSVEGLDAVFIFPRFKKRNRLWSYKPSLQI